MEIVRPDGAQAFLELARPLLAGDAEAEARHNLMLGIAATASEDPELYPTFLAWVALEHGAPVGAATRTPPFNLILADPVSEDALAAVLGAVLADDRTIPGLVGNVPFAGTAAAWWETATGATPEVVLSQGVYVSTAVRDVRRAPGGPRPATEADRDLLLRWLLAFAEEAMPVSVRDRGHLERSLDARLGGEHAGLWLWEDGGSRVSLAGYSGPTPNGIRIGPVYTPEPLRRQGYATALVADLSRWLLERGHRACFLYTDLANPTSNAIYTRIGYERVCDSAEIRFLSS